MANMLGFYWKKHFGWVAASYLALAAMWAGIIVVFALSTGSVSGFLQAISTLIEQDSYFVGYSFSSFALLLLTAGILLARKACTDTQLRWALIFGAALIALDFIPFIEQGARLLSDGKFDIPFTLILLCFHSLLLSQLWWFAQKRKGDILG
jgi:hypothetical protein